MLLFFFLTNLRSSGQPKNYAKTLFSHPPSPFPGIFLQLQQWWHLYCFAILGSASIIIHSMKQRLLTNWPGSDAATSRDFLRERLQRAFTRAKGIHSVNRLIVDPRSSASATTSKSSHHRAAHSTVFIPPRNREGLERRLPPLDPDTFLSIRSATMSSRHSRPGARGNYPRMSHRKHMTNDLCAKPGQLSCTFCLERSAIRPQKFFYPSAV